MRPFYYNLCWFSLLLMPVAVMAQSKSNPVDKFRQLEEILPTPNVYRTASGAPGHAYWQQKVDYKIAIKLDDANQTVEGSETVTYENRSPDTLRYLWVQLDQNRLKTDSMYYSAMTLPENQSKWGLGNVGRQYFGEKFDGGYTISNVVDAKGKALEYFINGTMMRIDLPQPLKPTERFVFSLDWKNKIIDNRRVGGRSGWEHFKEDDNYIYLLAQWFPRLAAYSDVTGWQNKQFLGRGEFALEFGDYEVAITVPADHVVSSTGVLQNPKEVLKKTWRDRLEQAKTADKPVLIVTPEEAKDNEKSRAKDSKTWVFKAENVRDFAWSTSRKFIWDAQGIKSGQNDVMAMSFYPNEGNPLWEQYSTASIIHTINVFNRYAFDYPYPVAISVMGPVGGMEYPMICFNGPRPESDGTYTRRTKYGLISVIIHEVGHFYFPMIVNSDERQWTWMDEGLNTYLQFVAEQEWEEKYPSRRGEPRKIVDYMISENQVPIMTNSESILQFGNNAYGKPATALNILRETILGRENFDFAFREFSRRWKFKRPYPADFFRTMEDASAVDLDWFWRGWFYSTDHVDIAIDKVYLMNVDTRNPDIEEPIKRQEEAERPRSISELRNADIETVLDRHPYLEDFYNKNDAFTVSPQNRSSYEAYRKSLKQWEQELHDATENFYFLEFSNIGGLVMPIILQLEYADGSSEKRYVPAEIWRHNHKLTGKMIITDKELVQVTVDPHLETADADVSNNYWPRKPVKSRFKLFKTERRNLMREMQEKQD